MSEEPASPAASTASGPSLPDEVVADTHIVLWQLYLPDRLSPRARAALTAATKAIHVSAITVVELAYLIEKARFDPGVFDEFVNFVEDPANGFVFHSVSPEIAKSIRLVPRKLVPDMPDRIVAATAVYLGLPLITADSQIRSSGIPVIW
jgi:PIN domain nuclease of toxin-antitoxin system